jgi:hypothetical protein
MYFILYNLFKGIIHGLYFSIAFLGIAVAIVLFLQILFGYHIPSQLS